MSTRNALVLAVILGVPVSGALAQPAAEPALLQLPMGARARVQTAAARGSWMNGTLASADSSSIAIVPEGALPLGANQLRLPSASIARFELVTGKKRHWLAGLVVGAALGLAMGATSQVDPVACQYDYNYECSRGEALAMYGFTVAGMGAGIGALIKTDRWTPVALDALAPPLARVSGVTPQIRALPQGGVGLGVALGF